MFDVVANLGLLAIAILGARDCASIRVLTTDTAIRGVSVGACLRWRWGRRVRLASVK